MHNNPMTKIDFKFFVIAGIIIYVPFHVLEEALGNFPLWLYTHYKLPSLISYPHWLINNGFFLSVLLWGLFLYLKNPKKYLPLGVGILFWALLNSMEHFVGSLVDKRLSPGFLTAILFAFIAIVGMIKLKQDRQITPRLIIYSLGAGFMYWIIPIVIIIFMGNLLNRLFPAG